MENRKSRGRKVQSSMVVQPWRSRLEHKRCIMLSCTEAECVIIGECVKEALFLRGVPGWVDSTYGRGNGMRAKERIVSLELSAPDVVDQRNACKDVPMNEKPRFEKTRYNTAFPESKLYLPRRTGDPVLAHASRSRHLSPRISWNPPRNNNRQK